MTITYRQTVTRRHHRFLTVTIEGEQFVLSARSEISGTVIRGERVTTDRDGARRIAADHLRDGFKRVG